MIRESLYDLLSQLRLNLAKEKEVPAFVIFSNRTLEEMANKMPMTQEAFLDVNGVGPKKWEQYGQIFLDVILKFIEENGRPKTISFEPSLSNLLQKILFFYQERDKEPCHSPKNLVMDLVSEVGKLVEPFRWLTEQQSLLLDEKGLQEARDGIGDVFKIILYLCYKLGIDPIQATEQKLEKTAKT